MHSLPELIAQNQPRRAIVAAPAVAPKPEFNRTISDLFHESLTGRCSEPNLRARAKIFTVDQLETYAREVLVWHYEAAVAVSRYLKGEATWGTTVNFLVV